MVFINSDNKIRFKSVQEQYGSCSWSCLVERKEARDGVINDVIGTYE